ncbi:MAG: NACHT domain-containing protein [Cyanobacteria bacterium P01_F01_bin.143]
MASVFALSLTISVWLGLFLPIYSQTPQQSDREILIQEIKDFADRHVKNDKPLDTSLVIQLYQQNTVGLTAPEIANIYENEFTRLQEIKNQEKPNTDLRQLIIDNLLQFLGWGAAAIIAIWGGKLKNWLENFSNKTGYWLYNRVSGLKFFWSFSLKRYRESLIKKYRQLKIPFRPNRPLEMRDIFVPLKVSGKSSNSQIDAFDAISKYSRLMIKGSPGSGKSMLLKYLAFSWADEKSTKIATKITPVLFELNRLNELQEFTLEKFQEKLVGAFRREDFPDATKFVSQALGNGNLMLLLDGLDEVNSNVRDKVIKLIKNLLDTYENCPVIITCRSAVYNNQFVNNVEQTLEIVEFSDRQIRIFLKAWEPEFPPEKSIDQLISTLRDRPQIIALARNPLLLTIIAYLYADTSFVLPHSRASFYEESVTRLLKLIDEEKQINNQFEAIHKRRVLQKLALYAQDNAKLQERDRRNIEYEQVLAQIRVLLPDLNLNPERDTQAILDEIIDRSGLLLPIDGGQVYQFSHLTLQEYFAAEALANKETELVNRFKQDIATWRETVKLWCGLVGNKTSLIRQIYQHDTLTGFECLADAKEVDQALADEIIDYFKQHLEKANEDDDLAKAFGAVAADLRENSRGRSIFEFLEVSLNNNSNLLHQKASAKALSFTNLPQAVPILIQGYRKKKDYCETLSDDDQLDAHKSCLETTREALVRMGDLAVPQMGTLADLGNPEFIQDLTKIATPVSANALVPFLWHHDESLRFNTALGLAELFTQNDIIETLQDFELTAQQKNNTEYLDWIWQPFNDSLNESLSIIAGRIVYLLDKTQTESIPNPIPKLDPRLIIPLLLIRNLVNVQNNIEWNSRADYLLEQQKQTPEIEVKITEQINKILGTQLSNSPWGKLLSSLEPKLELDLLGRVINQRHPTIFDWHNLYLDITYQFQRSCHYLLVLAVVFITSLVAIAEIIILIFLQSGNWLNGFLGLAIYLILIFWFSLCQGIEERFEPKAFMQFGLLGIVTFGKEIQRLLRGDLVWVNVSLFYKSVVDDDSSGDFAISSVVAYTASVVADVGTIRDSFESFIGAFLGGILLGVVAGAGAVVAANTVALYEVALIAAMVSVLSFMTTYPMGIDYFPIAFAAVNLVPLGMGLGFFDRAKTQIDSLRFLAIFALPYFCSFPIMVIFSTLFMLRYLTWQYTTLIWLIVFGTCTALWRYGQDKERKASNPLKGILDVAK